MTGTRGNARARDLLAKEFRSLDLLPGDLLLEGLDGYEDSFEIAIRDLGRHTLRVAAALDREAHEPADILVNGKVVARGEVVTIESSYGVRITSVERKPGEVREEQPPEE